MLPAMPKAAPMSALSPPALATHAPVSAPMTPRKTRLTAVIRSGIHGFLSAKSSKAANNVKIATAGTEPIRASGPWSLIQRRRVAHAAAAGGVNERSPLSTPITKASAKTVISMLPGSHPHPRADGSRMRSATTLRGGVSLTFRYSKVQEAMFMDTRLLMILRVKVATPQNLGAVPLGTRRTAPLSGGSFEGPRLRGTVVAGGSADWQVLRSDAVLEMDLRVTLQTDDGALILMRSFGLRHGPPEIIAAIGRGETVDPAAYYFRTTPRFETAHPAYAFLNRIVAIASGDRRPEGSIYTVHEVL